MDIEVGGALKASSLGLCALLIGAMGCGQIKVPAYVNLAPDQINELAIDVSALGVAEPLVIPLVGGLHGVLVADTRNLLSPQGIFISVIGDSIDIVGRAADLFGLDTGITCIHENPDDPTVGSALVRVLRPSSLDVHIGALASSDLLTALLGGELELPLDLDDVPLEIDFRRLLKGHIDGAIRGDAEVEGTLPADIPILGGLPYVVRMSLVSSTTPVDDPILLECGD